MTTEEKFQAAVNIIRSLPKDGPYQPSHEMMLKFYGLYKQAVEGPCTEPKPAFYEVVKGYKWQAWHALGSMSKAEAKNCYVEELKKIIETMAYTENVANFIDALGPFYEYVDVPGKKKLNNNTAKGPPSSGDLSDSCNEGTESSSSGRNTPITNGVQCNTQNHPHHQFVETTAAGTHIIKLEPYEDSSVAAVVEQQEDEESHEDESEDDDEQEEEEEEEVVEAAAATVSKVYSDSDTDEEYSEPAEQLSTAYTESESHCTPQPTANEEGAVTHGGGDKSHPGGLQMTPGQGFNLPSHSPGHSQLPLAFPSPSQPAELRRHAAGSSGGGGSGGGGGGGRGGRGGGRVADDVSAQLMIVLHRLQTDMESVLHRLNTLETLTLTQHHAVCRTCQGNSSSGSDTPGSGSGRSWWPFPELSPRSTFFLLLWPLLLHGGFKLLPLLRCRRKQS